MGTWPKLLGDKEGNGECVDSVPRWSLRNISREEKKFYGDITKQVLKWKKVKLLSCVQLCDPMGCSLQGSSIHGIF